MPDAAACPAGPAHAGPARYTATFIFAKKQFDDDFHRLDQAIATAARATPSHLGEKAWEDPARGLYANVYYWESLEALIRPAHRQAKAAQSRWLDGYRAVIAQVLRKYGDGLSDPALL